MITIHTHRQYATYVLNKIFPYIARLKQSHYNNVATHSKVSEQRLIVKLIYSLLDDVELIIKKKLINTSRMQVKFELTDAEAIALYKTFLILPIDDNNDLDMIKKQWLSILSAQIFE